MKTEAAPQSVWAVRVRWGNRRLAAELLDGRGRHELSLGDSPDDDVTVGAPVRVRFTWSEQGLGVRFSAGVTGTVSLRGDHPVSLSSLVERGVVREEKQEWTLSMAGDDALVLRIGTLSVDVRRARSRFVRLPLDARALLMIVLALIAVAVVVASVLAPAEGPKLHWLKRR